MAIFFDEHGQFDFILPDATHYHTGTVGKVWKMEHSMLCSKCGEPIVKDDLVIYEDRSEHGQIIREYYHEQHASLEMRELYAKWLNKNFPPSGTSR